MLIIGMLLRNLSIVKIGPYTKVLLLLQGSQMWPLILKSDQNSLLMEKLSYCQNIVSGITVFG